MQLGRAAAMLVLLGVSPGYAADNAGALPTGYWPAEQSRPIIEKTGTIRLAPDLSDLSAGERAAVAKLVEAGAIAQALYERQLHPQAAPAFAELLALDRRLGSPEATRNLVTLYRVNQGPITNTLDNERLAFLPVDPLPPGRNVYPWRIEKAEIEDWIKAHPEDAAAIRSPRKSVRRASAFNLRGDIAQLAAHPVLDTLHPGLRRALERKLLQADEKALYAVPYSVADADEMLRMHGLLNEAADAIENDDDEFARYLRNRSRDLLSDDYESGDAAWVTGRFKNLNAVIGAYETYDDELYGAKAFWAFSIMRLRRAETAELRAALRGLQALEDALPSPARKTVRSDIPIGLYDVIADFGQARGINTATILPNESFLARRYGRTVMLRANVIQNPALWDAQRSAWQAVVAPPFRADYGPRGELNHVLWHEVGHYLGVDAARDGRELDIALEENVSILEELKADLVSLHVAGSLQQRGYHTAEQLRAVYAAGAFRALNEIKPRRDQTYQTMQLMQFNFFLEHGAVAFDAGTGTIGVDYGRFPQVVGDFLAKVLEVQHEGDKAASDRFIERHTVWRPDLHGVLASKMVAAKPHLAWLMEYAALGQ